MVMCCAIQSTDYGFDSSRALGQYFTALSQFLLCSLLRATHFFITDQLLRQPDEAPKIPPRDQDPFTQVNREHKAIHKILGEKKLLDANLGFEKDVHARLGQKVTPDSLVPYPKAIMDELWVISDFTQLNLKKQPKQEKAELSDKPPSTLLSKLAWRAEQDVGTFITESEDPRIYRG